MQNRYINVKQIGYTMREDGGRRTFHSMSTSKGEEKVRIP